MAQSELPAGVLRRHPANGATFPLAASGHGALETLPLALHGLHAGRTDVVDVDVNGEARYVEEEEVEGRSPLEHPGFLEVRMSPELAEDRFEVEDFLDHVLPEVSRGGDLSDAGAPDHRTASHSPSTRPAGTTRFQAATRQPPLFRSR